MLGRPRGGGKVERPAHLWDFAGVWTLSRRIAHDDGTRASFTGRATLAPDGRGLRYDEEGLLSLPGRPPMTATRRHLWRPAPEGVAVLFADGRPFHRIDLSTPRPEAVHPCGADTYRVAYDLAAWPEWTAAWRVDGPRHAYGLVSRHAPLAGAGTIGHPPAGTAEGRA